MGPITTGLGEIYQYTLEVDSGYRDKYSLTDLRTIQDWIVRRQMALVKGVVEINAFGGKIKQYEVAVDPEKLAAQGLSVMDVFRALEANNANTGGAYIEKNHMAHFIRGKGLMQSLEDIRATLITKQGNLPITIGDVAKVRFGQAVRYGALTKDGNGEAVGGMMLMLKGSNTTDVVARVKKRIEKISKSLPAGVHISPFLDRSKLIGRTTSTVRNNLLEGALIVVFVLVFLLGNWRGGLIVASTIPLALLFAFIMMNAFGVWANLMSLGAIDFGIIIDGAVIIVESTVFLFYQKGVKTAEERDRVAEKSANQMMGSAFFGQLIVLIVFLPILALEGVESKMFQPMALTFMFSMLGVMVLCLTYVPMVSAWFLRVSPSSSRSWGDRLIQWLETRYKSGLSSVLKRPFLVLGLGLSLLLGAGWVFTRLGAEFMPTLNEGDMAYQLVVRPGSSLSETIDAATRVERTLINNFPEVQHVYSRIGVAEVPTDPMPMDVADCVLKIDQELQSAETKPELIEKMKHQVEKELGLAIKFTQPIELRFNELLTGVREDVAIKVFGEDLELLAQKAQTIANLISEVDGIGDVKVEATQKRPQMTVEYDRERLAFYGLDIRNVNRYIQTAFAGGITGKILEGERRFDLVVRFDSASRRSLEDVRHLLIEVPDGQMVPLSELADVSYQPGRLQISRDNTNRRIYVGLNVRGRDVKGVVTEIQGILEQKLDLPAGYYLRYGGAFENLERATARLQLVVPLALVLIFVLIFFALGSLKQTLMIYLAIPFAAIGGVASLALRGMDFSISAGVGFIVLFGVAVLNGLVLVNSWNDLKAEGRSLDDRVQEGAARRIRPILLTALTDIFGFLPMAVSTSAGAEVQQPLATVVIGGMLSATLLTLFVLPVLYRALERFSPSPKLAGLVLLGGLLSLPGFSDAQSLKLADALETAQSTYPGLKAQNYQIERQRSLKSAAGHWGNTKIYTGAEEFQQNNGVITPIGIQQQNISIFGTKARKNLAEHKAQTEEAILSLSEQKLKQQVRNAFGKIYIAKQRRKVYRQRDSLYHSLLKKEKIRLEQGDTPPLQVLSVRNLAANAAASARRFELEWQHARTKMQFWLQNDSLPPIYEPDGKTLIEASPPVMSQELSHPLIRLARAKKTQQATQTTALKKRLLPQLNLQYGIQQINNQRGFHLYQIGVGIPVSPNQTLSKVEASRLAEAAYEERFREISLQLEQQRKAAWLEYQKWSQQYAYYQDQALKLAYKQKKDALRSFRVGAISYVELNQYLKQALQTELNALSVAEKLLYAKTQLLYLQEL